MKKQREEIKVKTKLPHLAVLYRTDFLSGRREPRAGRFNWGKSTLLGSFPPIKFQNLPQLSFLVGLCALLFVGRIRFPQLTLDCPVTV
jgi:hypothetical protein